MLNVQNNWSESCESKKLKHYFTFQQFKYWTTAHFWKISSRNAPYHSEKKNVYYTLGCGHLSWFSWLRIPVSTLVERWKKLTTNCLWTRGPHSHPPWRTPEMCHVRLVTQLPTHLSLIVWQAQNVQLWFHLNCN